VAVSTQAEVQIQEVAFGGTPRPFALVHGAGGGGWLWDRVRPLLEEAGHEVVTPDLEMQEPETSVEDHALEVIFAMGELEHIVVVAHSYGGLPTAVVADRIPERLARVIYLDAFAPRHGESGFDQRPELRDPLTRNAKDGLIPPIPPDFAGADEEDHALLKERLQTTPLRCFTEPVNLRGAGDFLPRTYVWCTQSGFGDVAAKIRKDKAWDYRELDAKHMCMLSRPRETAELLLACAGAGLP
jgi:pimeloyl-ACP methyl ester carboxylesterase